MNNRVPSPYPIRNNRQSQRNQIIQHEESQQGQLISQPSQQPSENPVRNLYIPQLDIQNPHHNLGQQIFSQPHQEALQNILRNLNIPQLDIKIIRIIYCINNILFHNLLNNHSKIMNEICTYHN